MGIDSFCMLCVDVLIVDMAELMTELTAGLIVNALKRLSKLYAPNIEYKNGFNFESLECLLLFILILLPVRTFQWDFFQSKRTTI